MVLMFEDNVLHVEHAVLMLQEGFFYPTYKVISGALPRKGSSDCCAETFDAVGR
jgi:hypothetical protein